MRQLPGPMSALLSGPLAATHPLPSLLAASGNAGPAPSYAKPGQVYPDPASRAPTPVKPSNAYGQPVAHAAGNSATSAYPQSYATGAQSPRMTPPSAYPASNNYASYGGSAPAPTAAYSPSVTMAGLGGPTPASYSNGNGAVTPYTGNGSSGASPASYAPTGTATNHRQTQMYGQSLTNSAWQPALPVSPWSTPAGPVVGSGLETETLLASDLRKLRRSRMKAWFYVVLLLGIAGGGGYLAFKDRERLVQSANKSRDQLKSLSEVHQKTLARLETEAPVGTPVAAAKPGALVPATPATVKLADDLKRALAGTPVGVELRGNQVVVGVDASLLFSGKEADVGLAGYRTLYRFGKTLKTVKDRRVAITMPSLEIKRVKSWTLAAGRAVALGRFFTDDLGFDASRVAVNVPAPRAAKNATLKTNPGKVEFVFEAI